MWTRWQRRPGSGRAGLFSLCDGSSLHEAMFKRTLFLSIVAAIMGTACDPDPDPPPECWEEERCDRETELCLYSCRQRHAVKTCPECCMSMEKKCKLCKGPWKFNKCD